MTDKNLSGHRRRPKKTRSSERASSRRRHSNVRRDSTKKTIDGPRVLILFNKPYNTLSQFSGEPDDSTLSEYLNIKGVYPAGRLDKDSEGLLLLTNDGKLQHQISHPKNKKEKTYWVQVEGEITDDALNQLIRGVQLKDGLTLPANAKRLSPDEEPSQLWDRTPPVRFRKNIPTSWISLTIKEGKNRQVRRMTAAVGFPTLRLVRYSIDKWSVEGLAPGEFKSIQLS